MLSWLSANLINIVLIAFIAAIVVLLIRSKNSCPVVRRGSSAEWQGKDEKGIFGMDCLTDLLPEQQRRAAGCGSSSLQPLRLQPGSARWFEGLPYLYAQSAR